jgi:23S rRNA (uridine2552-2'-O)-methyltransferase
LAPRTSGIKEVDQQRSLALAQAALDCARQVLRPGGHFLVKVFQGPEVADLFQRLQENFHQCHRLKPAGSRPESVEIYLLGRNKKTGIGN